MQGRGGRDETDGFKEAEGIKEKSDMPTTGGERSPVHGHEFETHEWSELNPQEHHGIHSDLSTSPWPPIPTAPTCLALAPVLPAPPHTSYFRLARPSLALDGHTRDTQ